LVKEKRVNSRTKSIPIPLLNGLLDSPCERVAGLWLYERARRCSVRRKRGSLVKTGLKRLAPALGAALMSICFAAGAQAAQNTDRSHEAWRAAIAHTPAPGNGCFTASYPLTLWRQVACVKAPDVPYIPRTGARGGGQTVGNGHDYAAGTKGLTSSAIGSFPKVKGLKTENDGGRPNVYSIQLNSNFMSNDKACANAFNPSQCLGWEQFVYSSSSRAAFMQYWLIRYTGGTVHCPGGWNSVSNDCYRNSFAVSVPQEKITDLSGIVLTGAAVKKGIDTLTFVDGANAYNTTGQDTVMYLAYGWNGSEFNIIGDGGGSEATFNPGTSLTVRIDVVDGSKAKPTCEADAGTTGETNNLNLGTCKATKGKGAILPAIQFGESN
jgi:hypothetical protein